MDILKVPYGDIYTFRFKGYRIQKKSLRNLFHLTVKISLALEEGNMRNLYIFLKFLKVTYTLFVFKDI